MCEANLVVYLKKKKIYELVEKVGELQFCPDILYLMSLHPITEQTVWQDLQQMSRNTRIY